MNKNSPKDQIYANQQPHVSSFAFDNSVAAVFDDMISRSVPIYSTVQNFTAKLVFKHLSENCRIYDLGCASGNTIVSIAKEANHSSIVYFGVDNSQPMLERCRDKLTNLGLIDQTHLILADLAEFIPQRADVIILNYTLQFIPVESRPRILKNLYDSLNQKGLIIISEKVVHSNPDLENVLYSMHIDFKRTNGYTDLEISQKRDALENVLVPHTTNGNINILRDAGFANIEIALKWFNFATIVAYK